jgi:hypothetical protein
VFSRADLSRTVVLVVALSLTFAATGAFAREFRVADSRNDRTNVSPIGNIVPSMNVLTSPFLFRTIEQMQKMLDRPIGADPVELPYGQALTGLALTGLARAQRDPAVAQLIERIRKAE